MNLRDRKSLKNLQMRKENCWIRSVCRNSAGWKEKRGERERSRNGTHSCAEQEELTERSELEIQAETQKTEQREQDNPREGAAGSGTKGWSKRHCWKEFGKKRRKLAGKKKKNCWSISQAGRAQKERLESGAENSKRGTGRRAEKADGSTGGACGDPGAGSSG